MSNTIFASSDAGNGGTNTIILTEDGKYKSHYEPSVRAVAHGDSLGLGAEFELQYDYVDWYGNRYVTGDDVVDVTSRALERHMGSQRYGEEFHRFLVAVSLAKLGIKEGEIDLTLFAPPGLFGAVKSGIVESFGSSGVKIQLKKDKKPREWKYSAVNVYPEGIGAAAAFMLDEAGKPAAAEIFAGENVVLDSGAFTMDALQMSNGNFNPEMLQSATWENAGVNTHVREPLLRKIHAQGEDWTVVTIDRVDRVIRQGLATGDYTLKIAGYEVNLKPWAERYFERYADWVSNNICDGMFNGFRGIKSVILVGGGATMIAEKLNHLYPGKLLDRKQFPHVKKVHPVDMNAVGGMRLTLARVRK